MNKIITFAVLLLFFTLPGMAQSRANIKGRVIDSLNNEALEFATVAVLNLKDSSLISYTLTVKGGEFTLHNLPAQKDLKLVISFVSYQNYRKIINLEKGATLDLGALKLKPKGVNLNEVKVTAEITPVIIKKDTIEFNAEAFKTPPNAMVEELLKLLPGIQVDMDGTITANGKKVTKILINGKQFFVNDPKIASRNLDASLIDKVQIYDDRDDDPDHLIPDSKVNKIINLKFKNAIKKSTFCKVRAGAGTEGRFDGGLLYNTFRDTLQVSLIGIGNNLNRTGFSSQELSSQGGFDRGGVDADNSGLANGGRAYGGIETVGSGGVNINTDYGKKLKINLLYFYSYTADAYNSKVFGQQILGDTTLSTNATSVYNSASHEQNISSLVEWNPDTNVKVRYTPKLTFNSNTLNLVENSNSYNNFLPQLNQDFHNRTGNDNSTQFQQTFSYYHKLGTKGASLNITNDLSISPVNGFGYSGDNLTSYTTLLPSSDLYRMTDNSSKNTDVSLNVTYRYPFSKKIIGDVSVTGNFNHNNGQLYTFNQNLQTGIYDMYIDSLSHNLQRYQYTQTLRPELTYQFNKQTSLIVNLGMQLMQTDNAFGKNIPDINRRNFFLLPGLKLNTDKFSVEYDQSIRQPSINDLMPLTTFYSTLYSTIGNPGLKPTRTHSLNTNFYNYNNETQFSTNIYSNISVDENSIFSEKTVSSEGATISEQANKNGYYAINTGGGIGKGFKKINNWQIGIYSNISGTFYHNFFQVNNNDGYQNSTAINLMQQINVNYKGLFQINPSYNLSPNITTYQNVDYPAVKYVTQKLDVPIVIHWPKHTTIETNYTYTYNPLVAPGFQRSVNLLNIAIARQIQKKDRGEIRLSCYDLFNQNTSSYRYIDGNSIDDVQSQILKRYLLLTYSYRFDNTVTKK